MHFLRTITFVAVITVGVNGMAPQRQVLVTYPQEAPQSDLDEYKSSIQAAGGQILHDFNLFK